LGKLSGISSGEVAWQTVCQQLKWQQQWQQRRQRQRQTTLKTANNQRRTTNIGNAKNLTHYEHLGSLAECI